MENKKRIIKKRELIVIFIIVLISLLYFSGYSMGKVYQNTNVQANAKIAEPILLVENGTMLQMNGESEKGYYNFKVKNIREDGKINQMDLEYYIEILTQTKEWFSFKLYKGDEEIKLENNKTENIVMKKGELQEDDYKLEITYDKEKIHSIDDITQDIQVKVHSEQLKL